MTAGFKESLSQINKLIWTTLALSASLLILEPTAQSIMILGISINIGRLLIVVPIALVGLLLSKQVIIINVIEIIHRSEKRYELREIILSYPLVEFMRWKFKSNAEIVLLTVFQISIDVFPAISLLVFWHILESRGIAVPGIYKLTSFLLIFLGLWNYTSLRRHVFEPLVGEIRTPD